MSVMNDIIQWSESRPRWQRDALRRLTTASDLADDDIDEIFNICKKDHKLPPPDKTCITCIPISKDSLATGITKESTVKLSGINDVKNVNLISNGESLPIQLEGLSVVYGGNGSGKSGFVRILKKICRARGSIDDILPNVYVKDITATPSSTIEYQIDGKEDSYPWIQNLQPPDFFQGISIFDEYSAPVYVNKSCEVAYIPYGLDLLPRLVDACKKVHKKIDAEISTLSASLHTIQNVPNGTKSSDFLSRLNQEEIEKEISLFTKFTKKEEKRTQELTLKIEKIKIDDPKHKSIMLKTSADRIDKIVIRLKTLFEIIQDKRLTEYKGAFKDYIDKEEISQVASVRAFADEPLNGIGSKVWQSLWESARKYSEEVAQPGKTYPSIEEGDLCVLCLQPLTIKEIDRFQRFENFVKDDAKTKAEKAREKVTILKNSFESFSDEEFIDKTLFEELSLYNSELAEELKKCQIQIINRIKAVKSIEKLEDFDCIPILDPFPIDSLGSIEKKIRSEVDVLSKIVSSNDKEDLKKELNELLGKKIISENIDIIKENIDKLTRIRKLTECLSDTDFGWITRKNSELTEKYVTSVVSTEFGKHIKKLNLSHLPISLSKSPGGQGVAYHQIYLSTEKNAKINQILSKGEHRAVALAGFLSELSTQESESTVVFDDPVSSLDHDRRRYVAESIVEISKKRPVLVFSHDLVFLKMMTEIGTSKSVDISFQHLLTGGKEVGIVRKDLPWIGQAVKSRIGEIKDNFQSAKANYGKGDKEQYEKDASVIYGKLRETWERSVEEVLINRTVERFSNVIHTNQILRIWKLEESHLKRLEDGMTKCSRYLPGHDDSESSAEIIPIPNDLEKDIIELDKWIKEVRKIFKP